MAIVTPSGPKNRSTRPETLHGSCLCAAVVFEVEPSAQYGPDRAMGFCHCLRCQRWSGGAGLPFVVVCPEHFRVVRGQEVMSHYRDDASTVRAFCRWCGSSLYADIGATYYVGAGVLHDLRLVPGYHIFVTHKAPWDHITGTAPQFDEALTHSRAI